METIARYRLDAAAPLRDVTPVGRRLRIARYRALGELIASIEGLVPVGAPITPARQWGPTTCCGCGRSRYGDTSLGLLPMLRMRWAASSGAELRTLRCDACGPLVDALVNVWTGSGGAFGSRLVAISGY